MMLPQELITQAREAVPPVRRRGRRAHLYPVIIEMTKNGHTVREAVEWLSRKGKVLKRDITRVTVAFNTHLSRSRKEQRS